MAAAGAILLGNTSSIGSMGLLEALPFILPTLQLQKQAIASLKAQPPDLVVLIDYMGPNMKIGSYIHSSLPQVPVVYYIAPQVWVWSVTARATTRIIEISNKLLAIFPEEARYFEKRAQKLAG
jgi:lipid-A-disaccharide synthase